tara:strand:+ start:1038 stop:1187 length:150 start_codon:yes stop_codon:yes gene_type:complete
LLKIKVKVGVGIFRLVVAEYLKPLNIRTNYPFPLKDYQSRQLYLLVALF